MPTTIEYTINSGTPNFTARLDPEVLEPNVHTEFGTYSFENVPNGTYTLIVTDSNGCTFEKQLVVNPLITTTITTQPATNSLIVGCTQTTLVIFNEETTNTDIAQNLNTNTYLWFKTTDSNVLNKTLTIDYTISGTSNNHNFNFINVSDQLNFIVNENNDSGNVINGEIILLPSFNESYFLYQFSVSDPSADNYEIILTSTDPNVFNISIDTKTSSGTIYDSGIDILEKDRVVFTYINQT